MRATSDCREITQGLSLGHRPAFSQPGTPPHVFARTAERDSFTSDRSSAERSSVRDDIALPAPRRESFCHDALPVDTENRVESITPTRREQSELRRIYTEAFRSVTWRHYDQAFLDAAFAKELAGDPREWTVARRGKSIAGFCTLEFKREEQSVYIAEMAVDPIFAHQGVGKSLIEFVKNSVPAGGTIELVTRRLNLPAIALYEKMGFRVIDRLHAGYDPSQYLGMICHV